MNQSQLNNRERAALNTIRSSNRISSHMDCIRVSTANTFEHEMRKFLVCWELLQRGHRIMTEAIFENNSRCDVLDLSAGVIYEILHTETEEEADKKFSTYPVQFQIRYVKTSDAWRPELLD